MIELTFVAVMLILAGLALLATALSTGFIVLGYLLLALGTVIAWGAWRRDEDEDRPW